MSVGREEEEDEEGGGEGTHPYEKVDASKSRAFRNIPSLSSPNFKYFFVVLNPDYKDRRSRRPKGGKEIEEVGLRLNKKRI